MALLAAAVVGEGAADAQLAHYRADAAHRGGVCDVGLWAWSRHPNYFFESLGCLAYAVIAIGPSGAWPLGWVALIAPAFMFVLLRFVSGVPPTEAAMARSRGERFAAYQAQVSAFFPLPPRAAPHRGRA
jgi:steroid 5-alpha reductase family enzyme